MQKREISRSLEAIIAKATFSAIQLGKSSALEDILFLELIATPETLCYQLLSEQLDNEQLKLLEQHIRGYVTIPNNSDGNHPPPTTSPTETPEHYYQQMLHSIIERYPTASRISSIHALHFIVSDSTTTTSKRLAMMGLTKAQLEREIEQYSATNALGALLGFSNMIATRPNPIVKEHPLSKFGIELTAMAHEGKIDPVIGRDELTERVVEILSRRKKNNPILVGEAGVGKSAIVEGLAIKMASGDVPHTIRHKRLFSLDIAALVAGTKFRGEFEERMQQLLQALKESQDAIIFIDEIHTIVGAGSTQGSLDIANILKPALARGELQTIGATTLDEYRTNIEPDAALVRRMQRVLVEPTTEMQTIEILHRIAPKYAEHHRVSFSNEAIEACVTLSQRYITDRHLPDKAIDMLDQAGAKANIKGIESVEKRDIEGIITATTGIPVSTVAGDELTRLRNLEHSLSRRVVGQANAVKQLVRTIKRSRSGLADENKPTGVFLFIGPTGVGKTLLAKELSRQMFSSDRSLIRIDMSEYNQSHTSARLTGAPPGYIGYGEGGELSEAVRRNPYSVILLDEIEKAHPDIFNLMLQIFDEGRLTDGAGRSVDFRNTIIIMTSNIGSQSVAKRPNTVGYATSSKSQTEHSSTEMLYKKATEQHFTPEFLNRIDETIIFNTLNGGDIESIVALELEQIFERTRRLGYNIRITPAARRELAALGYESRYGARALRRTLLERVEEPLSEMIVDGEIENGMTIIIERLRRERGVKLKVA